MSPEGLRGICLCFVSSDEGYSECKWITVDFVKVFCGGVEVPSELCVGSEAQIVTGGIAGVRIGERVSSCLGLVAEVMPVKVAVLPSTMIWPGVSGSFPLAALDPSWSKLKRLPLGCLGYRGEMEALDAVAVVTQDLVLRLNLMPQIWSASAL